MKKKFSLFTILALATVTLAGCEKTTNLTSDEIDKLLEEVVSKSVDVNSTTSQQVYYDDESGSSQTQDMTGKLYDNNIYFNEGTIVDEGSGQSAKIFEAQFVSGDKMYYIYDFGGYASESYKKTMDKPATDEEVRNSMVIVTEELLDGLVFDLFTDSATITGTKKGSKETVTLKEEYVASPSSNEYDRNVSATINFEKGSIRKIEYSYSFYEGEILSHTLSGFNTFAVEKVGNYDPSTLPLPDSYYEWVDKTIVEPLELPESTLSSAQINAYVSMASDLVESKATSSVYKYDADSAIAIAMDPNTGEILAMASRPNFNSNDYQSYSTEVINRNLPIWMTFEPGSTFKIITLSSAIEEGLVNIFEDRFTDSGAITVDGATLHCWKHGGHGNQTYLEVVENSCNPGFVNLGLMLGKEKLMNYIKEFGFGEKTGIDLNGEGTGILFDLDAMGNVELATTAFGQGISVTPIHLVV